MSEENIKKLLESVNDAITELNNNQKVKENHGETFNVFSLCGVDHYEIWHSKILAEFLNPRGMHGQGTRFLQTFAEKFLDSCEFSDKTSVSTEVTSYIKNLRIGRFDVLIEDASNKSVCIIENKIFAGEQEEQLTRYHKWLTMNRNGWNCRLVFLTLDGHESVTISSDRRSQYLRIAYASNNANIPSLIDWIEDCANSVKEIPRLCYTFIQYKDHIQKLTNGDKAMINKMFNARMAAAQQIYENYKEVCENKANSILKNLVCAELGDGWNTDGCCRFGATNRGIHYIPPETDLQDVPKIYVVFGATNLWQCQVALYRDVSEIPLRDNNVKLTYNDDEWTKDFSENQSWPLWRGVKSTKDKPLGMTWDGEFFDKMESDDEYKNEIISDIVQSIRALHCFLIQSLKKRKDRI
jgi:hypothetical protein